MENENENVEKKWYQKTWGIIILFIIFPPVGLYFLWKSDLSKNSKLVTTGIFALLLLLSIVNDEHNQEQENIILQEQSQKIQAEKEEEERKIAEVKAKREEEERKAAEAKIKREEEERRAAEAKAKREEEERKAIEAKAKKEEEIAKNRDTQSVTLIPGTGARIVTSSIRMTDKGLKAKIIGNDDKKYTILFIKGSNGKMDLSSSIMYEIYEGWDSLNNPKTGLRDPTMTKILEFMRTNQ